MRTILTILLTWALLSGSFQFAHAGACGAAVRAQASTRQTFQPKVFHVVVEPLQGLEPEPVKSMSRFKLLAYNIENFFIYLGKLAFAKDGQLKKNEKEEPKSLEDAKEIAQIIDKEIAPDAAITPEAVTEGGLDKFSKEEMGNRYEGVLVEGNDERGIDIGSLFGRRRKLFIEVQSYREVTWQDPAQGNKVERLFSRDAPVFILRAREGGKPFLIIIGVHSKSKRDRSGDPESVTLRTAQHQYIADNIIRDLTERFGKDAPIAVVGDANTDVVRGQELDPLRALGYRDALDFAPKSEWVKPELRWSQAYFPKDGDPVYQQLDAILLAPVLHGKVVSAYIGGYKNSKGQKMGRPKSFKERSEQPSDHNPYLAILDLLDFYLESLK